MPWAISIYIMNPSPPTWLDTRIVIQKPQGQGKPSAQLPPWPSKKGKASAFPPPTPSLDPLRGIQFRLQTKVVQLQPSTSSKRKAGRTELVAKFSEDPTSASLQYPYRRFSLFLTYLSLILALFDPVTALTIHQKGVSRL